MGIIFPGGNPAALLNSSLSLFIFAFSSMNDSSASCMAVSAIERSSFVAVPISTLLIVLFSIFLKIVFFDFTSARRFSANIRFQACRRASSATCHSCHAISRSIDDASAFAASMRMFLMIREEISHPRPKPKLLTLLFFPPCAGIPIL